MDHNNESLKNAVQLYLSNPIEAIETYGHIEEWNTENVTNMRRMFCDAHEFNQDISKWNVSNVTDMAGMFCDAYKFNQDIGKWDVSNVMDINSMFCNAYQFSQNIGKWNVGNAIDMGHMFWNAYTFNQNISMWDVSNATDMNYMFYDAHAFLQNISYWTITNNTSIRSIISGTKLLELLEKHDYEYTSCFNKQIMSCFFPYSRRKNFMHFLVENGFEPFGQKMLQESEHILFDKHDINYYVMSFL